MCGETISKIFLFAINIGFVLISAVAIGLGVLVTVSKDTITDLFAKIPSDVKSTDLDVTSILSSGAYVLIGTASVIFIISFMGCCGAWKEIKIFLYLYSIIICVLLIIQIAAVVLGAVFQNKVEEKLKDYMNTTLIDDYKGSTVENDKFKVADDTVSLAWDGAQIEFKCCGTDGGSDYVPAKKWIREYSYQGQKIMAKVPATCCKVKNPDVFPSKASELQFVDIRGCLQNPNGNNSNVDNGCYDSVKDELIKYAKIILAIGASVFALELIAIICACSLAKKI